MSFPSTILLAGGSSSRFAPLTEKNLFKFNGKTLVKRQIDLLSRKGAKKIVIITNENNFEDIKSEAHSVDPDVKVVVQVGEGQSGAVTTGLKEGGIEEDVLIMNVNDIFDEDLFDALQEKRGQNNNFLVGVYTESYFPGGYLVLEDNNVVEVVEKPGEGNEPSDYVRIVFDYFASGKGLLSTLENVNSENDDVYEVALSEMMKNGDRFEMIDYKGSWETIKYPWHVLSMMEHYLGQIDGQQISENAQVAETAVINGNVVIEDGVKVFDNAVINGPAYIGRDSIVANGALVRDSMIGEGCVVGFATEVARSYVSDRCWFHTNYIGDSILGENVSFGSGAVTANLRLDEGEIGMMVKGEKVMTGKRKLGNVIGNDVRIGINASLMPGVKVGTNTVIGSGVLLTKDIEDGKFVYMDAELEVKDNRMDIAAINRDKIKKQLEDN
ncbi:NTP transferase domain-containing protein [Candidatus Dojkabacteria bacterium]|nr:NTP transferase domain-containing protein [Candidatus Dojkabacteria bacterium]